MNEYGKRNLANSVPMSYWWLRSRYSHDRSENLVGGVCAEPNVFLKIDFFSLNLLIEI